MALAQLRRMTRSLGAAILATLALACGGPNNPGEMPPLAPQPDRMQPMPTPGGADGRGGGGGAPVPGAPDPLAPGRAPDAGPVTRLDPTGLATLQLAALEIPMQQKPITARDKANPDGGIGAGDAAAPLPAPTDSSIPTDASRSVP